ncbi:MAG: hypothetical protein PUB07_05510 [Clostridia bacterium]|nr:hypothetical protein [Clostridia bacterium]
MGKIDRLLTLAKAKLQINDEKQKQKELAEALDKMTTEQLIELAYHDVSEDRLREIFESVGGLGVLEGW